jgi:hypothetical protein
MEEKMTTIRFRALRSHGQLTDLFEEWCERHNVPDVEWIRTDIYSREEYKLPTKLDNGANAVSEFAEYVRQLIMNSVVKQD